MNAANNLFQISNHAAIPQKWFDFHKTDTGAEIRIDGEIGGWGISAKGLTEQIKALDEDARIKLHIFSPGGDVLEGNEIYNALSGHKGGVDIEIGALCASIATVIACAGDTVSMAENGLFMVHNPFTIVYGDAEDMRATADILDKMKGIILDTYEKKSSKSRAELVKMMDETTWLDAEETKAAGFVDKIHKEDDEEDIEDRFDLSRFKNSAVALSKLKKKTPKSEGGGETGGGDAPSMLHTTLKTKPKETLVEAYMKGNIRIFNSIAPLTGPIYNNATGQGEGGGTAVVDPEEIKKQAKALYEAKLKRDKAIDDIVLSVRKRDKKDFADLASKYKGEDKTAEEFAMAIATSDEFKPAPVIDGNGTDTNSGRIDVLGVLGIPKGSLGEQFVASEEYRALRDTMTQGHRAKGVNVLVKSNAIALAISRFMNAASTSAGLTSIEKLPGVVGLAVRPLTIKDLIASGATTSTVIRYIQETTFSIGAAPVGEGAAKPEQVFAFNEVDAPVKKIAAWTKMTEELYADYLAVASFINQRMPYMVERVEEDQLLKGDGTGNNLLGIMATPGIQTLAKGAAPDTQVDAIYRSFTKIRWANMSTAQGGFEPDGIVLHPTDWEKIRLSKDANGQYFGGGPFTAAYGTGGYIQYDTLWGKPVAVTPAITAGTALVGAFRLASQYFQRQGVTIESTNTDQDDFIKNLMTIRAETRLALCVYRPVAFCTVTGL